MKIENVRPQDERITQKGFKCLATFNLELNAEVKLYDLQLLQAPDGKYLIVPPKSSNDSPTCSLAPRLRDEIAQLASKALIGSYAAKAGEWFKQNFH